MIQEQRPLGSWLRADVPMSSPSASSSRSVNAMSPISGMFCLFLSDCKQKMCTACRHHASRQELVSASLHAKSYAIQQVITYKHRRQFTCLGIRLTKDACMTQWVHTIFCVPTTGTIFEMSIKEQHICDDSCDMAQHDAHNTLNTAAMAIMGRHQTCASTVHSRPAIGCSGSASSVMLLIHFINPI